MGYVKKILSTKSISNKPVFYTKTLKIDLSESFHLHYRNNRIEMSPSEFKKLSKSFVVAWLEWNIMGRPKIAPPERHIAFSGDELPESVGDGYPSVRGDEITVELQYQADYIHLHYRGLRVEYTIDEFKDFAEVINDSLDKINNDTELKDYPKRMGINHIIQPKNRVSVSENIGKFIINDSFIDEDNRQEISRQSLILDEKTGEWKKQFSKMNNLDDKKLPNFFFIFPTIIYLFLKPLIELLFFKKPKRNLTIEKFIKSMSERYLGNKITLIFEKIIFFFKRVIKKVIR